MISGRPGDALRYDASNVLPRLVFFPGLGCDERMLNVHRPLRVTIEPQAWLAPSPRESLAHYAERYVSLIDTSTPFFLAGISLGGMIAQEVAARLRPQGLILIATCRSNRGVPPVHAACARLVGISPDIVIKLGERLMPKVRRIFGIEAGWQVELFAAMLAAASPDLIRWSLKAVVEWPGVRRPLDVPILAIHGKFDRILPLRTAGPIDCLIETGGHAVSVARAREVNDCISKWLMRYAAGAD